MAIIKRTTESTATKLVLDIDNGDLQALNEVIEKIRFIDEQATIRFALFALLKAEKNVLYVDQGDKLVVLTPSSTVIKPEAPNDQA